MATRTPDHITVINEQKETQLATWDTLGSCPLKPVNYPIPDKVEALIVVKSLGGGQVDIRIWDFVAGAILASTSISGTGWQAIVLELSGMPTSGPSDLAYVTFEFRTDGVETCRVKCAALEVC